MDMQMPVMDGLAATRAIRAHEEAEGRERRTPVAMLSANAMDQHRNAAFEAGADRHIAKPVTAQSLIAGVLAAAGVEA
jgi:CheY-like chemotaxis protein